MIAFHTLVQWLPYQAPPYRSGRYQPCQTIWVHRAPKSIHLLGASVSSPIIWGQ